MPIHPATPYPGSLTASWSLGLSHSVRVRPLQPEDFDLWMEFAHGLSNETRYNRLLGAGARLTPQFLERSTRVDFSRDMALIAVTTVEGAETAIGVARYARLEDDLNCEIAITIADAWQGRGIGRRLLTMLIETARERGVARLVGDAFATNTPMLRLASSLGCRIDFHPAGGELRRVTLDLLPPQRPNSSS